MSTRTPLLRGICPWKGYIHQRDDVSAGQQAQLLELEGCFCNHMGSYAINDPDKTNLSPILLRVHGVFRSGSLGPSCEHCLRMLRAGTGLLEERLAICAESLKDGTVLTHIL